MRKIYILLSFLFLVSLISVAKADTFELMEIPAYLDAQLGCGEFIGGLLASIFALMITLFPLVIMTKGKSYTLYILFFFAVLAPLVGLGWFPVWLYIILLLAIALGFGQKIADVLGGIKK